MLVLTRKEDEKICIGDDIVITIVRTSGDRVRLGIEAPSNMIVLRSELKARESNQEPVSVTATVPFDRPCAKCS